MFVPFETANGSDTYYFNVDNIISIHASRTDPDVCYIKLLDGNAFRIGMPAAAAVAKIATFSKN